MTRAATRWWALALVLFGIASSPATAESGPPWRECTQRKRPFSAASMSMSPLLPLNGQVIVTCFDHAMANSTIGRGDITLASISPAIKPGDLIVFRHPIHTQDDWIKRLIGVPGDLVEMHDGRLILNGKLVATEAVGGSRNQYQAGGSTMMLKESLPNGKSYLVLPTGKGDLFTEMPPTNVPDGALFVLGDNRPNSLDSRARADFGFVPISNLIGRVDIVQANLNPQVKFAALPPAE